MASAENRPENKPRPWMIAAWPGMGNVAVIAAGHLVEQLSMSEAGQLTPGTHFDVTEVDVHSGIVQPVRLPRGVFFGWQNPGPGRDLVVFIGESQPAAGSFTYAMELIDAAKKMGVERVVTFASLASGLHPSDNPTVRGVATDRGTLDELRRVEVGPIPDGQIGGLNGLLLGAAAAKGMPGMCLLAEIPFFAMRIPNPKASRAALSVFSVLAGIDLNLEALNRQGAMVDKALIDAMERFQKQEEGGDDDSDDESPESEVAAPGEEEATRGDGKDPVAEQPSHHVLDPGAKARIEELFAEVKKDTSQAMRLKNELDRLGVFKEYEGRFLDLFRKAG